MPHTKTDAKRTKSKNAPLELKDRLSIAFEHGIPIVYDDGADGKRKVLVIEDPIPKMEGKFGIVISPVDNRAMEITCTAPETRLSGLPTKVPASVSA